MNKCYLVWGNDYGDSIIDKVYLNKEDAEKRVNYLNEVFKEENIAHMNLDQMDKYAEKFDANWMYVDCHFSIEEVELVGDGEEKEGCYNCKHFEEVYKEFYPNKNYYYCDDMSWVFSYWLNRDIVEDKGKPDWCEGYEKEE